MLTLTQHTMQCDVISSEDTRDSKIAHDVTSVKPFHVVHHVHASRATSRITCNFTHHVQLHALRSCASVGVVS